MLKVCKILVPVFLVLVFSGSPPTLALDSSDKIDSLVSEKEKTERDLRTLKGKLDSILVRVETAKKLQKENYSIFREFGLQKLLKSAQALTDKISVLAQQRAKIDKDLMLARERLFLQYNSEIEYLLNSLKKNSSFYSTDLAKLKKILIARSSLSHHLPTTYRSSVDSLYIDPSDSPEDILAKAGILEDYGKRLTQELNSLEERLSTLKRQNYAFNEISHLLEEEDFFTETGFLKSVQRKGTSKITEDSSSATKETTQTEGEDTVAQNNDITEETTHPSETPEGKADAHETSEPELQGESYNSVESTAPDTSSTEETTLAADGNNELKALDTSELSVKDGNSEFKALDNSELPVKTDPTSKLASPTESSQTDIIESSSGSKNREEKNSDSGFLRLTQRDKAQASIHLKDLTLDSRIEALEKERQTLKKLINEIQIKYSSMRGEATKLKILKMK